MPVIEETFCEVYPGAHGRNRLDGDRYQTNYKVNTDDPKDQAQTVDDWFRSTKVNYGDPYTFGNDALLTSAVAIGFDYQQAPEDARHWKIQVDWDTPTNPMWFRLDDEKLSRDPLEWRPLVRYRSSQYTKPAERMYYESGYSTRVEGILTDDGANPNPYKYPVNSALQPFVPPPELDESLAIIIVEGPVAAFTDGQDSMRFINSAAFAIDYMGVTKSVQKFGAKMTVVNLDPMRFAGQEFLMLKYEMEIKTAPDDWVHLLTDKGDKYSACPDQPDGRGNLIGQSAGKTPIIEGIAETRNVRDFEGDTSGVVLFDGDGQPLLTCSALNAVGGRWRGYEQKDFTTLPLISQIVA